jgi:sialate O-acetylesterase
MMKYKGLFAMLAILAAVSGTPAARAAVSLSPLFADNMMFQRDKPIRIWGQAAPGEAVTVSLAGKSVKTLAAKDGTWLAELPALSKGEKLLLRVSGKNTVTIKNLIIGDVWLCGGQSNMHFSLKGSLGAAEDIKSATFPAIRHMKVDYYSSSIFLERHVAIGMPWQGCSPQAAGKFTAVGFYFARKIHKETGVPIGLINVNRGGTRIELWIPMDGMMRASPSRTRHFRWSLGRYTQWRLSGAVSKMEQWIEVAKKALQEGKLKDHDIKGHANLPGVSRKSLEAMERWIALAKPAIEKKQFISEAGVRLPGRPKLKFKKPEDDSVPNPPDIPSPPNQSSLLYMGMIHPLTRLPIKGLLWYQGESNALGRKGDPGYLLKQKELVGEWRKAWKDDTLPFYFVQLPYWKKRGDAASGGGNWAALQEAQLKFMTFSNTGMAVTIDIGDARDLHPKNKLDVGLRLARWALKRDYGKKDLVVSGPLFRGMKIVGGKARISFAHTGSGLMVGTKKGRAPVTEDKAGKLKCFAIAGADKKWVRAQAVFDGDAVVVSSPKVKTPVAVRYAYSQNPEGVSLYNREGLPASPFRTDRW